MTENYRELLYSIYWVIVKKAETNHCGSEVLVIKGAHEFDLLKFKMYYSSVSSKIEYFSPI